MEADQETILSRHPSPLVGQRSDQHDPSPQPVSRFNACYFSRWIKERQAERWADAGVRENKKGWMTQTWCKEMIPPPLPIMLWNNDIPWGRYRLGHGTVSTSEPQQEDYSFRPIKQGSITASRQRTFHQQTVQKQFCHVFNFYTYKCNAKWG